MRDINQELNAVVPWIKERNLMQIRNLKRSRYPFVYCPECGKRMWNDNTLISKHFREKHIRERSINADRGYRFHPISS